MILTDGIIEDMDDTINALVEGKDVISLGVCLLSEAPMQRSSQEVATPLLV